MVLRKQLNFTSAIIRSKRSSCCPRVHVITDTKHMGLALNVARKAKNMKEINVGELLHELQRPVYYVCSFGDWFGLRRLISFGILGALPAIKGRYTRGSLLPQHAPATRSRGKLPRLHQRFLAKKYVAQQNFCSRVLLPHIKLV